MSLPLPRPERQAVSMKKLWSFFLPLGVSASLVTISHVIINSTLSRSADPEKIISSYAVAMSLLAITERPAVLLRQTCSTLVRDKRSFRSTLTVAQLVFASIMLMGLVISYTPLGTFIFQGVFGVGEDNVGDVLLVYRVLMFVSLFSGIRCFYQGIIIYNLRTKWLTIGMAIRLAGMYALSLYFIHTGVTSGVVGAIIFLFGMMIEAAVSFSEGRVLARQLPDKLEDHAVENKRHVFSFYRPLLLSSFISLWIGPAINAMLGKTWDAYLSISSFAIASSLVLLLSSFFSYFHQIVINFYRIDPAAVRKFTLMLGFVPVLLMGIIAFTPVGDLLLEHVIGVHGRLRAESIRVLQGFVLFAFVMPWLDVMNGLVFVRGQTKLIIGSQIANFSLTFVTLLVLVALAPQWNGTIGAWAQSIGMAAELLFVVLALRFVKPADPVPSRQVRQ
ncbi:multi antimicrobial extrusion protein MatE [Paenibacillus arenilitoris]|uniref:Multi antimicrobial extrusion protein MatE n=1 Tax=Paenibacillus arenilitoris TaxID=2772299 RepID=A0A927CFK4_9BACL|nr:multi antimicrobial extrusion protein MatE [Paenibacillus arenilitoris]MBD2867163.1 multi antimicrobial extrusion protein MatE [Paenibacillus arenilitoris]